MLLQTTAWFAYAVVSGLPSMYALSFEKGIIFHTQGKFHTQKIAKASTWSGVEIKRTISH
jgi:hypothetical protein